MRYCVVCGKPLAGKRIDAQCCDSNCRHKLATQRKKVKRDTASRILDTWQGDTLSRVRERSPEAAACIDKILAVAGKEVAEYALLAAEKLMAQ